MNLEIEDEASNIDITPGLWESIKPTLNESKMLEISKQTVGNEFKRVRPPSMYVGLKFWEEFKKALYENSIHNSTQQSEDASEAGI